MIKRYLSLGLLSIATFNSVSADPITAETNSNPPSQVQNIPKAIDNEIEGKNISQQSKYQEIIDEYRKYLSTVDKKTRDEVINFRKETIVINQKKKDLYKSLSQEAQLLLEKEKEYKKKLPINQKKQINVQ